MPEVELSRLLFHAFHGVHEEENRTGGDFEVDLTVYFDPFCIDPDSGHMDET